MGKNLLVAARREVVGLPGLPADEAGPRPASGGPDRRSPWGLLLSGSIGRGHDSVAEACMGALGSLGVATRTLDCMSMLGGYGSRVAMAAFRAIIERPTVYDAFHFNQLRNGTRLPLSMQRASDHRLTPKLLHEIATWRSGSHQGAGGLVVAVFPTGVSAAVRLKERLPQLRVVTVCTDACAHRMWVHQGVDLYVVGSMLAATSVLRYDPRARVSVVPSPVRPRFYDLPERAVARAALGLDPTDPTVLVMSGGWGRGPLAETAAALAAQGYQVLAVAGQNRALYGRLERLARSSRLVHPFGFTEDVPTLMAAADAVVTSPGQTCHEARVAGRWLVVLDVVPGHGRENALHEVEVGGAFACSPDPESVVGAVGFMFKEQPAPMAWPVRSAQEWDKHFLGALSEVGILQA